MRGRTHPLTHGTGPRTTVRALMIVLALGALTSGCSGSAAKASGRASRTASTACHGQWKDVARSVLGLDQDTDPSALASRWTTVIATVDYYLNRADTKGCQQIVERQVNAISSLRQFSEKLRPYDMAYQLSQVSASVDLYVHDTLPGPVRNATGKLVPPPSKHAVAAAYQVLDQDAAVADTDLQPGWEQMASVDLGDVSALRTALVGLDTLARGSAAWQACESALQVLVAAVRAQEGQSAQPDNTPSPSLAPTP